MADGYLGFDRSDYPGDDVMADLYNSTSLFWCGFYLAPAPSHPNTGWMGSLSALRGIGWGIAPIYVGQQWPGGPGSHVVTEEQGSKDADHAAELAGRAGFEDGAVLYLDIEIGGPLPQVYTDYASAWFTQIQDQTPYLAGTYCSYRNVAKPLLDLHSYLWLWPFNINRYGNGNPVPTNAAGELLVPDVADCGVQEATMWQYAQNCPALPYIRADGSPAKLHTVDMNVSDVRDPSQP